MAFPPGSPPPVPSLPARGTLDWDSPLDDVLNALADGLTTAWQNDIDTAVAVQRRGITPVLNSGTEIPSPRDGQLCYIASTRTYQRYDGATTAWVPFLSSAPTGSAAGDLSGTYPNPTVTGIHLAAPLAIGQGGTGSATQNFVDLATAQVIGGGKTFTSVEIVNATGATGSVPYGRGFSGAPTGIQVLSSYPTDDVSGGTDGTGRINLYSYQRANFSGFGETIRNFLMRYDAKAMTAWYGPTGLYDGSGNPVGTTWAAWTWCGSHYEANSHDSIHGHYEIEVPDSTGALQGRFIVPFADDWSGSGTYGHIGLDVTNIRINQADLTIDAGWGVFRVGGSAGVNDRAIEFASSIYRQNTGAVRWRLLVNNTSEAGANAGSDFVLRRFDDSGTLLGTSLFIQRSDGQKTSGAAGSRSARFAEVWGTSGIAGFSAQPTASIGAAAAFDAQMSAATERVVNAKVTGDSSTRFVAYADGKHEWGSGSASRDTNLYRGSAGVVTTDNHLDVVGHAVGVWTPRESGFAAATGDPRTVPSGSTPVGGTIYLSALFVSRAVAVTKIFWCISTVGATPTAGQNWIGLIDPSGSVVASVGVDARVATANVFSETISTQNLVPGTYRVAFLFNAGTLPAIARHDGLSGALLNAGIASASNLIHATNGTTQTVLPASFTLSSNVSSALSFWAALQ